MLVDWSPVRGCGQAGVRPALVLQNNTGNRHSSTTIVVALNRAAGKRQRPFHVLIEPGQSGLREASLAKCEQILTVSCDYLLKRIGQVPLEKMAQINRAMALSLNMENKAV